MQERIKAKLEEVEAIYDEGKYKQLTPFSQGILRGINQTLSWLLEPDKYVEPLIIIPGLKQ